MKQKIKSTLWKKSSTGKIQQWEIFVDGNTYWAEYGQEGGAIQADTPTTCKGKNIGRANETTPEEQALSEANSKWTKQVDIKHYVEDRSDVDKFVFTPMLAQTYTKHHKKLPETVLCSPKLDGCLDGSSLLYTKEHGLIPIECIVDNKLECKVKSFNIKTGKDEYKSVKHWFKDRELDESIQWFEIQTESGRTLKLTGNHKVYLPQLKCWRRVDELNEDDEVLIS